MVGMGMHLNCTECETTSLAWGLTEAPASGESVELPNQLKDNHTMYIIAKFRIGRQVCSCQCSDDSLGVGPRTVPCDRPRTASSTNIVGELFLIPASTLYSSLVTDCVSRQTFREYLNQLVCWVLDPCSIGEG